MDKPCNDTGISSGDRRHTRGCPNKFGQCCKQPDIHKTTFANIPSVNTA